MNSRRTREGGDAWLREVEQASSERERTSDFWVTRPETDGRHHSRRGGQMRQTEKREETEETGRTV